MDDPTLKRDDLKLSGTANADGLCDLTFGPVPNGRYWTITTTLVSSTSALDCSADVYVGSDVRDSTFRDGTASGNKDVALGIYYAFGDDYIIVEWAGCTPGSTCKAVLVYTESPQGFPAADLVKILSHAIAQGQM